MAKLLLLEHPGCQLHDPAPAPGGRSRLAALLDAVAADRQLARRLARRRAAPAEVEDLLRVHAPAHVERVRAAARTAATAAGAAPGAVLVDGVAVSGGSWAAALAAAGCAAAAVEAVATGEAAAAFALAHPPGHLASADRASGSCLFNNVAVAIRRARARGLARQVLVVHWGAQPAGTQQLFEGDPAVRVLPVEVAPRLRDAGPAGDRGRFLAALDAALATFAPDLVVAAVGLDALEEGPEGGGRLAPGELHRLTADLLGRVPASAERRLAGVLEGGEGRERTGAGLVEVLRALAGLPSGARPG